MLDPRGHRNAAPSLLHHPPGWCHEHDARPLKQEFSSTCGSRHFRPVCADGFHASRDRILPLECRRPERPTVMQRPDQRQRCWQLKQRNVIKAAGMDAVRIKQHRPSAVDRVEKRRRMAPSPQPVSERTRKVLEQPLQRRTLAARIKTSLRCRRVPPLCGEVPAFQPGRSPRSERVHQTVRGCGRAAFQRVADHDHGPFICLHAPRVGCGTDILRCENKGCAGTRFRVCFPRDALL